MFTIHWEEVVYFLGTIIQNMDETRLIFPFSLKEREIAMKKRVYTLYRVSTKGQVEKDDIPMQKEACRNFAEGQGWEIVKEFSEKGVSGFKKSAKKEA